MEKGPIYKILTIFTAFSVALLSTGAFSAFGASLDIDISATIVSAASPQTSHDYDGAWRNADFTINLAATSPNGIKETYYKINDGLEKSLSTDGQPLITTEGADNRMEYWSLDNLDAGEWPHKVLTGIRLDKTAPQVIISSPQDETAFDTSPITITGVVTDALSGINTFEISLDGTIYQPTVQQNGDFNLANADIVGGPNSIIAMARDFAGNEKQETVTVFLGWVLHLQIPYSNVDNYYSGAACTQMVLNYMREGVAPLLTQEEIYNYGHPYNFSENQAIPEMDPCAADYALGHFDPYDAADPGGQGDPNNGYNFSIGSLDNSKFSEYLRAVIHWMAYPVTVGHWSMGGDLVAHPNTPSMVPAMGIFNNWIVVNGAATDADPAPDPLFNPWYTPDFTVYGLWLTDPAQGGVGQDLYITAETAQDTYLLPLGAAGGTRFRDKYVHVSEPPDVPSQAEVSVSGPRVNEETIKVLRIADAVTCDAPRDMSYAEERINNARRHLFDAALVVDLENDGRHNKASPGPEEGVDKLRAVFDRSISPPIELDWKKIVDALLLTDENFCRAFDKSQARNFIKIRRLDKEQGFYYLIPFDKYIKGQFLTYAAIIVDAGDGSFKEASWVEEPARFVQVTREDAINLAASKFLALQNVSFDIELVWRPGGLSDSPFYPYWKIVAGDETYFVTQEGEIVKEIYE